MKWPNSWKKMMTPEDDDEGGRRGRASHQEACSTVRACSRAQASAASTSPQIAHGSRLVRLHHGLDGFGDGGEGDALVEEGRHRLFVGGVQDRGERAPAGQGLVAQAEAREPVVVGDLELQAEAAREVHPGDGRLPAFGIGQRVLDGQPHVGHAELGQDGAVHELHHGVHDRLRVHQHLHALGGDAEQPPRLDHLQAPCS
jgi:hypothetical protein